MAAFAWATVAASFVVHLTGYLRERKKGGLR